jgi:hypothetical protein
VRELARRGEVTGSTHEAIETARLDVFEWCLAQADSNHDSVFLLLKKADFIGRTDSTPKKTH